MKEKVFMSDLLPPGRHGFIHKYKRRWSAVYRDNFIPIAAYYNICKGEMNPVNAPFCGGCHVHLLEDVKESARITLTSVIHMFAKKIIQREVYRKIINFVGKNLQIIVKLIIEDGKQYGLSSTHVIRLSTLNG